MPRVLLFDIDNTLLYTGGAGGVAMNRAFHDLFGINDGFARIEFSGATDLYILATGLSNHAVEGGTDAHLEPFLERYYRHLPVTMREKDGRLMPGFPELLDALSQEPGVVIGLATGNFSEAGWQKLRHYGIDGYFTGGGFGEISHDRSEVVRAAIDAVAGNAAPDEILVIGDTPRDVSAALENGVVAVGVATGSYGVDELRESGAHMAFEDFSDWRSAAEALLRRRRSHLRESD